MEISVKIRGKKFNFFYFFELKIDKYLHPYGTKNYYLLFNHYILQTIMNFNYRFFFPPQNTRMIIDHVLIIIKSKCKYHNLFFATLCKNSFLMIYLCLKKLQKPDASRRMPFITNIS